MAHLRKRFGIMVVLVFAFSGATLWAHGKKAAPINSVAIQVNIRSRQVMPSVIHVHQGERVRLVVNAADGRSEFQLRAYGIDQILHQAEPAIIEFTASKPGTFTYHCRALTGLWRHSLKGKLVVEARP